jgi:cytochrome b561
MSSTARYTRTAMILHWLVAGLILINVGLALSVDALPDAWVRPVIDTHKSIGITVLGLFVLRLLWRLGHTPPPLPASFAGWEKTSSHIVHICLYGLMLALPVSGWLHDSAWKAAADHPLVWFHMLPVPRFGYYMNMDPVQKEAMHKLLGAIHASFGFLLYGLLFLHVGGALKHEWIDKESVLRRMWPGHK